MNHLQGLLFPAGGLLQTARFAHASDYQQFEGVWIRQLQALDGNVKVLGHELLAPYFQGPTRATGREIKPICVLPGEGEKHLRQGTLCHCPGCQLLNQRAYQRGNDDKKPDLYDLEAATFNRVPINV